jgi:hypothetical protein
LSFRPLAMGHVTLKNKRSGEPCEGSKTRLLLCWRKPPFIKEVDIKHPRYCDFEDRLKLLGYDVDRPVIQAVDNGEGVKAEETFSMWVNTS